MSLDNELLRQDQRTANAFTGSSFDDVMAHYEERGFNQDTTHNDFNEYYEETLAKDITVGEDGQYFNKDGERVYYYTPPSELGDGGDSSLENHKYLTESEIQEYWDADQGMGYFKEANPHIDFDTHMQMVAEKQGMIEDGTLDVNPYDSREDYVLARGHKGRGPNADAITAIINEEKQNRAASMLEAGNALNEKYDINTTFQNEDGDTFVFNGSNYHKSHKVDDHLGPGDYARMAGMAVIGMAGAAALGPMVQGALGAAGTTTSASGVVSASGLSKGLTSALSNSLTQLASGNGIDPKSVLASGVIAGFNPGGTLTEKLSIGGKTIGPDSFLGGVVTGGTNNLVSGAIQGDIDLKGAALSGLGKGAMNSLTDFFDDTGDRSIEQRMRQVEAEHVASFPQGENDPLYKPLSDTELYNAALSMRGTGTSDLAGLIGKDGLIKGIDEVDTTWLNHLMGGGDFDVSMLYQGPDGKMYKDTEIIAMGLDPDAIEAASYAGQDAGGWSSFSVSREQTAIGKAFEKLFGGAMDSAAKAQFISEYGFDPEENPEAAKRVFLYGKVDETFTFSDNPRGESEVIGQVQGKEDKYSTGTEFNRENIEYTEGEDTYDFDVPYADLITMAQDAYNSGVGVDDIKTMLDGYTNGSSSVVLPGSNVSLIDSIIQGVLDGAKNTEEDTVTETEEDLTNPLVPDTTDEDVIEEPSVELPPPVVEGPPPELPPPVVDDPPVFDDPPYEPPPPVVEGPPPELPPELPPPVPPSGPPILPGDPPELPGGMMSGGDYDPEWGELFGYTTITPYQAKQLAPVKQYIKQAKGMLS